MALPHAVPIGTGIVEAAPGAGAAAQKCVRLRRVRVAHPESAVQYRRQ
ncbi:hypothetical protein BCL80_109265 [Streptomyces avidinii]|uniref:Uncharacterized protein n=1 Tax=Streptomyces pratensis (strain ATCC 33331 / IAF-45CD) TaxID=591167 RepID=A0A8D3WDV7_STRFA|nr:hypothetical protein [Streptomyces pratensis]RAS27502.1 hypothetical protein BCL80_109265 [Streptomyces avidinii]SNX80395.1 hypothetical protein SAMN05421860_110266 [Streptomyces microflavus]